jgi:hypothetical protein
MAEAEYATGPRLISNSDSFAAWSDVPENLRKVILRLLPNGPMFLRRVDTSHCKSGWLAGCAHCASTLWAVKAKGRHGEHFHAEALESHFEDDVRHQPDVSAVTVRATITHSLPTPRGRHVRCSASACLNTHFHRRTRTQWIARTRTCACIGHSSVR